MKEKIVHLMKSEGLTSSRLAEILEIQPSGISHIVSGRNKPGFDLLQKILRRFPQINPDWLLLDSPTMYRGGDGFVSSDARADAESSLAIDLFDLDGVSSGDNSPNQRGLSGLSNGSILGSDEAMKMGENFMQNSPQNRGRNSPLNLAQNLAQDEGQISAKMRANLGGSSPAVQRVIILYADGTFRTYESR